MQILLPILIRIIAFLFIFIAAQEAKTDAQALPLSMILSLIVLDSMLVAWTGKGIYNYLKQSEK